MTFLAVAAGFTLVPAAARAADTGVQFLPTGVVFPGFTGATLLDAAGLVHHSGKALALESSATGEVAHFAVATGTWGLDVGYGVTPNTAPIAGVLMVGGAVRVSDVSLGLSTRHASGSSALFSGLDASFQIGGGSGLQFAAVFTGLPSTIDTMTLGLGYREAGKYSFEGGVQTPFLTQLFSPGASAGAYLGCAVFPGSLGLSLGVGTSFTNLSPSLDSLGLLWSGWSRTKLSFHWNPSAVAVGSARMTSTSPGSFAGRLTLML